LREVPLKPVTGTEVRLGKSWGDQKNAWKGKGGVRSRTAHLKKKKPRTLKFSSDDEKIALPEKMRKGRGEKREENLKLSNAGRGQKKEYRKKKSEVEIMAFGKNSDRFERGKALNRKRGISREKKTNRQNLNGGAARKLKKKMKVFWFIGKWITVVGGGRGI